MPRMLFRNFFFQLVPFHCEIVTNVGANALASFAHTLRPTIHINRFVKADNVILDTERCVRPNRDVARLLYSDTALLGIPRLLYPESGMAAL